MEDDPLSAAEIDALFPQAKPPFGSDVFEIGITLSGTVSAGAYTGGVLDYLMEALDAWRAAVERDDPKAPRHKVVISVVAGASGGGINALVTAKAGGLGFSHGAEDGNPFYDTWAGRNAVTFNDLFSTDADSETNEAFTPFGIISLFNTNQIADLAERQCLKTGPAKKDAAPSKAIPAKRDYFADPMRVFVTLTNIAGTIYDLKFSNSTAGAGYSVRAHDDQARFIVSGSGGPTRPGDDTARPGEIALNMDPTLPSNWAVAEAAAMATSAFPFALGARQFKDVLAPAMRPVVIPPGPNEGPNVGVMRPRAVEGRLPVYVDGGVCNNDPVKAAHEEITGVWNRNPRRDTEAFRAIIMIDPFADPMAENEPPASMAGLATGLANALKEQSRLSTADLALATSEDCFSRYLVAPSTGDGKDGGSHLLASASGDAFGGFASRERLQHDYALGRYNAHNFLKKVFAVPLDNVVIVASEPAKFDLSAHCFDEDGKRWIRLIPLMQPLLDNPPQPPNPPSPMQASEIDVKAFQARAGLLFDRLVDGVLKDKVAGTVMSLAFRWPIKGQIKDYALKKITEVFLRFLLGKQT